MKTTLDFVAANPWTAGILFFITCLTICEVAKWVAFAFRGELPKDEDE